MKLSLEAMMNLAKAKARRLRRLGKSIRDWKAGGWESTCGKHQRTRYMPPFGAE